MENRESKSVFYPASPASFVTVMHQIVLLYCNIWSVHKLNYCLVQTDLLAAFAIADLSNRTKMACSESNPIRDKKTNVFNTSMTSPSRQHYLAWGSLIDTSSRCRVWALQPETEMKSTLKVRVWALQPETEMKSTLKVRVWAFSPTLGGWPVFILYTRVGCQY